MFLARETSAQIVIDLVAAATSKAGNANRLAVATGVNPATLWRVRQNTGTMSVACLLNIMGYLGWNDAIDIVTGNVKPGTVGDFIRSHHSRGADTTMGDGSSVD